VVKLATMVPMMVKTVVMLAMMVVMLAMMVVLEASWGGLSMIHSQRFAPYYGSGNPPRGTGCGLKLGHRTKWNEDIDFGCKGYAVPKMFLVRDYDGYDCQRPSNYYGYAGYNGEKPNKYCGYDGCDGEMPSNYYGYHGYDGQCGVYPFVFSSNGRDQWALLQNAT
jgi:hypothetical protein